MKTKKYHEYDDDITIACNFNNERWHCSMTSEDLKPVRSEARHLQMAVLYVKLAYKKKQEAAKSTTEGQE